MTRNGMGEGPGGAPSGRVPPADATTGAGVDPFADPAQTVILDAAPDLLARPRARRDRCVVLLPGVSGVDTTATAAGLGLALASLSAAEVLLLDCDAAVPGTGLCVRFGLAVADVGAMFPVAPRLTYRRTGADELPTPWPDRFGVLLVHCGPGPSREVLDAVVAAADQALLLTPDCATGVESAAAALDWLAGAGRRDLAASAVVALAADPTGDPPVPGVDRGDEDVLRGRCRSVLRLPAAAHAPVPGVVDPALLPEAALDALTDLAREISGA